MNKWTVSMANESEQGSKKELSEGIHKGKIIEVAYFSKEESKSGNPFFKWVLDIEGIKVNHITTGIKGKRWALKQILSACGIEADPNDPEEKYSFEAKDVLLKEILVTTKNKVSSFIGREGNEISITKPEVTKIEKFIDKEDEF